MRLHGEIKDTQKIFEIILLLMKLEKVHISMAKITSYSNKDTHTHTHNEEKISNNLFDLQFHIVKKKLSFTKPQTCSSRKQVHMNMNTSLLQLTQSSVREPHTQPPREGYYSALITLTQTGVKPRERGLHN